MKKIFTAIVSLLMSSMSVVGVSQRYVGGDISLLPEYEKAGAVYYDHEGKKIDSLLPWLHEQGMNAMRVRLFVNPDDYKGTDKDANACQDLEYITPLCQQIVNNGFDLMLDFHYSDTWADPGKQWTPAAWSGLSDEQLYDKIYEYTKDCLQKLKAAGVTPAFIQPGNEISYGMLWGPAGTSSPKKTFMGSGANWERLGQLLKRAVKACREECPEAKIVLHTERVAQPDVQQNFYDWMKKLDVDYDIIGLSYYPYFHGDMKNLDTALNFLQQRYPEKKIMIVETGYSYAWAIQGTDQKVDYDYSDAGQDQFARELVATLEKYENCDGLFWWWMEYNAYGTNLSGWYNAPLFDSRNGRATSALKTICSYATSQSAVKQTASEVQTDQTWFDMEGRRLASKPLEPGIYICNGHKVIIP